MRSPARAKDWSQDGERTEPAPEGRARSGPDRAGATKTAGTKTGATSDLLLDVRGSAAFVTLNRPAALNALTPGMLRALAGQLPAWAADPAVRVLVLRGAGDRAFCSGGDVVAVWRATLAGDATLIDAFFREEYRLDRDLARFPKPQVSLWDGIVMGGGAGLSVYGSHRVATERTVFAMPETAIGFFCDVGASWFLPRLPGGLGLYLALTGARLRAADLLACGLATHFVPSARLPELTAALEDAGDPDGVLAAFAEDPGPAPLVPHRDALDRCFGAPSVEGVLESLRRDSTAWAEETLAVLGRMSPASLKVVFRELRHADGLDLDAALAAEFRVSQRIPATHDFREGVRAALVDRDGPPRWNPARLEDVREEDVEALFAPLGERELWGH